MNEQSIKTVQELFGRYYGGVGSFGIRSLEKRELAFTPFGKQGMVRHTSFQSMPALIGYVRENPPLHFYYSSAYYDSPDSNMDNKRWKGADLIFDIDGDHIEGADRMRYSEMLSVVKEELIKLLNILTDDLSVSKNDLEVVFSGSRGYHVHVYSVFEKLESQERREIVDYISGRCVSSEYRSSSRTRWDERINNVKGELIQVLESQDKKWKQRIEEESGESLGDIGKREFKNGEVLERVARKIAIKRFSSRIDEPVSIDVHRLIRTPGSLHGKSGLLVKIVDFDRISQFDPIADAIPEVFRDNLEVIFTKAVKSEFGEAETEYREGKAIIPTYAALFWVLRGAAEFQVIQK